MILDSSAPWYMVSNRLILVFLGIILILIVAFSSNRLAQTFRSGLSRVFPQVKIGSGTITPSPTPQEVESLISQPPQDESQIKGEQTAAPPQTDQIPSTGAAEIGYMILGGSALVGILTRTLKWKIAS